MSNVVDLFDSYSDCNNPAEYQELSPVEKERLQQWITRYIKPNKAIKFNPHYTSYGLKHLFESNGGFYITNGQFKGAMLVAGFEPNDYKRVNWHFKISNRITKTFK